MIKNLVIITYRNFIKGGFYSLINIAGLAVGLTIFLLMLVYITHELSYDRFHSNAHRIFRFASHLELGGNATDMTASHPPFAAAIKAEFPEVEVALRMSPDDDKIFRMEQNLFTEDDILYTDPEFFQVFTFELLAGSPATALKNPNQIVLSEELFHKYFGTGSDFQSALNKNLYVDNELFEISGIVENCPANSHFKYKALMPMRSVAMGRDETWDNMNLATYVLLKEDTDPKAVETKVPELLQKYVKDFDKYPEQGIVMEYSLHPLTAIHLHSNLQGEFQPTSNISNIYILATIAFVVLLLACINFMNLTTARSSNRAKEVGVRKVLGSERNQLIRQFTFESVLMVTISMAIAVLLASLMKYPFNYMAGKELTFDVLRTPGFIAFILGFIILLGVVAGSYPSLYLSSFNPVQVLKGKLRTGMRAGSLRNTLVILQFAISIVLITCTIIVQNQLQFLRAKKLGFDKENLMIVENANRVASAEAFMDELRNVSGISAVSAAYSKPVDDYNGTVLVTEEDKDTRKLVNFNIVDYDYLKTMNISMLEGRWFSNDRPSDSSAVVINETAANYLFSNPVGKKLYREKEFEVIGVIGDFNFESLKTTVRPLIFFLDKGQNHIHIRLEPGDYTKVVASVEALWKKRNAEVPFIYSFADDDYNKLFAEESRLGMVFGTFTVLAIFIACLGLLGLMAYSVEQRTKEISVRKVLGASIYNIITMLSGQFGRLIVISLLISIPVAYLLMNKWLDQFAYKTSIGLFSLLIGSVLTLMVSFSIIAYQAFQAARVNPASTLKGE